MNIEEIRCVQEYSQASEGFKYGILFVREGLGRDFVWFPGKEIRDFVFNKLLKQED